MTSARGERFADLDTTPADMPLWRKALQSRGLINSHRHLDSHCLKFIGEHHTNLATLDATNPQWLQMRSASPPQHPPAIVSVLSNQLPSAKRKLESYAHHNQTCPACALPIANFTEYVSTATHLWWTCTNPDIQNARRQAIYNLGERLFWLGAPNWWASPPQPLPPPCNVPLLPEWALPTPTDPPQVLDDNLPLALPAFTRIPSSLGSNDSERLLATGHVSALHSAILHYSGTALAADALHHMKFRTTPTTAPKSFTLTSSLRLRSCTRYLQNSLPTPLTSALT